MLELRPALNTEIGFETIYGLARDGKTSKNGVPNILQLAVMFTSLHKGELYLAKPPIPPAFSWITLSRDRSLETYLQRSVAQ